MRCPREVDEPGEVSSGGCAVRTVCVISGGITMTPFSVDGAGLIGFGGARHRTFARDKVFVPRWRPAWSAAAVVSDGRGADSTCAISRRRIRKKTLLAEGWPQLRKTAGTRRFPRLERQRPQKFGSTCSRVARVVRAKACAGGHAQSHTSTIERCSRGSQEVAAERGSMPLVLDDTMSSKPAESRGPRFSRAPDRRCI